MIMPTGSGKTRIAALDISLFQPERCFYIAHTHEILRTAIEELEAFYSPSDIQKLTTKGQISDLRRINISTIQFVARNLVLDEFHHTAAVTYRRLIDRAKPKFLLGLTATPFRRDRQNILELCDGNVIVNFELRTGIDEQVLEPYHYYGCFDDINYSK